MIEAIELLVVLLGVDVVELGNSADVVESANLRQITHQRVDGDKAWAEDRFACNFGERINEEYARTIVGQKNGQRVNLLPINAPKMERYVI